MRYTFGAYTLDTQRYEFCQTGISLQLHPKVFDLLAYLLQHRDRVVTRQELFDTLWPEHLVSDDALEWVVAAARRAVGDSGRAQRVIQTVRSRGYRWVAPVAVSPLPGLIMRLCLTLPRLLTRRTGLLCSRLWLANASKSRCLPVPCLPW